jgi:hypothetical protein
MPASPESLLVIFGAGASYDSVDRDLAQLVQLSPARTLPNYQPPLANA